jgi:hypothetical protein
VLQGHVACVVDGACLTQLQLLLCSCGNCLSRWKCSVLPQHARIAVCWLPLAALVAEAGTRGVVLAHAVVQAIPVPGVAP